MKKLVLLLIVLWTSMTMVNAQNVGVNADGTAPDNSAMLDVKSTIKGFLPPRMTIAERDAIGSPANGLIVFCTDYGTSGSLFLYSGGNWAPIGASAVSAPVAGTHVPETTKITWNWNPVAGATGYKWNTTNNVASATDVGTSTTCTQTGLTGHTTNTLYVWAYSSSGVSTPTTLRQPTLYIGMPYQGGRIFYIYPNGQHGLIAAVHDQTGFIGWTKYDINITTGTAIGTGQANTTAIVAAYGAYGMLQAAGYCDRYEVTEGGVIYDDWFLPSKDELSALASVDYAVGGFIEGTYPHNDFKWYYWSSSQSSSSSAYYYDMFSDYISTGSKSLRVFVRAVRAF